jgi:hypothetical protein
MIFRAHDRQSHFDPRATLPCKSQVRLTRDKCSKESRFAACRALFTYAQQVQIACAIGEAIEALTPGLQKMSAQLEASKPAVQIVNSP